MFILYLAGGEEKYFTNAQQILKTVLTKVIRDISHFLSRVSRGFSEG